MLKVNATPLKLNEKTEAKNKSLLTEVEELKQQSHSSNSYDLANANDLIEIINTIDSSKNRELSIMIFTK